MAVGHVEPRIGRHRAHHGDAARALDHLRDQPALPRPAHPVQDDPRYAHVRIERAASQHEGARRPRHARHVQHEDDRRGRDLRDLGRRRAALGIQPVVQAHGGFDHARIGARRGLAHHCADLVGLHEVAVEVAARPASRHRVPAGVDEVGALLERLDGAPLPAQRTQQPQREDGLAAPAVGCGNHDPGHSRACHVDSAHKASLARARLPPARPDAKAYTQPVGFSRPAILQAPLPGPLGNSS